LQRKCYYIRLGYGLAMPDGQGGVGVSVPLVSLRHKRCPVDCLERSKHSWGAYAPSDQLLANHPLT